MLRNLMVFLLTLTAVPVWASGLTPSRYLTVNGTKIAIYESAGHEGPGVLLIHGNTSAADSFAEILHSAFAATHRVVALDLPGSGNSDNAAAYSATVFSQVIAQVATTMHVDQGVILGWSLGGDLALQAASLLPKVRGYFLIGTAPLGYTPTLPPPFLTAQESYAGAAVNYGFVPNLTGQQVSDFVHAFFRPGYLFVPQVLIQDGQRTDPMFRAAVYVAATGQDPGFKDEVEVATGLQVPIALVIGEHDALVRLAYLQALAPQLPTLWNHRVIVARGSGHIVQWERPAYTLELLRLFINSL